jgi:hypothetical protein
MSDPLRIALVAEGATEHEVIDAALKVILAPRRFVLTPLQPEATKPDMGRGWGGVLKWCHQLAARSRPGGGAVEADPTLSNFDGVVLQLDADVATFAYSHLGLPLTDAEALASGWLPLPCPTACPPAPLPQDALFSVLLSWLSPATPGAKTVVCIPAMSTGAWQAAAKLPAGHPLLVDLECRADIEDRLQQLPLALRVDKRKRESRLKAAAAVTQHWTAVTALCSRAHAFDQAIRAAFP